MSDLSYNTANYSRTDIYKQQKRAKESRKKLVHDSIKARLYCTSYGKLKADESIQSHNNSIRIAHELWKIKNGVE